MAATSDSSHAHPGICCEHSVGRGDLLRLVHMNIPREEAGALCGFVHVAEEPNPEPRRLAAPPAPSVPQSGEAPQEIRRPHLAPPLWRAIGPDLREPDPAERQRPDCLNKAKSQSGDDLAARSHALIAPDPLVPPARLGSLLRRLLTVQAPGVRLDEPRLVRLAASLRPIVRLPRQMRRAWTPRLQVYCDQAQALGPCLHDQVAALRWLQRWRGPAGLESIVVSDSGQVRWYPNRRPGQLPPEAREPLAPDPGTTLLLLGDLAFADKNRQERWTQLHRRAIRAGARCRALVPCPRSRWQPFLASAWHAMEWERSHGVDKGAAENALEDLFVLLSPAIRIEPGLLRAVRRLLPRWQADVGVELDAWMDPRVIWRAAPLGMVLDPKQALAGRAQFLKFPDERRAAVVKLLERFHGHLAPNILAEERVACGAQVEESLNQFAGHALGLLDRGSHHDNLPAAEAAYLQRLEARLPAEAWKHDQFAVLWGAAHRMRDGFAKPLPDGLDISQVVCVLEEVPAPAWWQLCQRGTALHLVPKSEQAVPTGSPLAEFRLRLPQVELRWTDRDGKRQQEELRAGASIEVPLLTEPSGVAHLKVSGDLGDAEVVLAPHPPWADRFWRDGSGLWVETTVRRFEWKVEDAKPSSVRRRKPKLSIVPQDLVTRLLWPTWAKRLDKDEHGLFAEVELADKVVTRLRWIPPGRFLMGAPVAENGRDDEKGPQHWVKLSMGYWLADAPCTQAEWQAVMGTTRSHFKGAPDLPAEQVNWKDCLAFCTRLQARFPGLQARLPSEAEWEYACRAGTASAFNDGSACTEPQGKDPALAKLGYYDNNSEGKTHVVCCLAPNQWGLHDMHGNVWEWCQDGHGGWYGDHAADEQEDPVREGGHQRVIRGGSWINRAGFCRSACRSGRQPSVRIHSLGFRLASGQSGQDSKSSQERAAGKLEGRRPDATGGERAGKQKKGRK